MRIVLLISTLFVGVHFGSQAFATVNQQQEQRADQFCEIDPAYCK
jgi:hypothetical protein